MTNSIFTEEDLTTKDAIAAVIYDADWKILIQEHIKLDFNTIIIGKVKDWENPEDVMKQEIFDETWLTVIEYKKLITKEWIYDYNWTQVKIRNHIYIILQWVWDLINKEPEKHRSMWFMAINEIENLSKISDATKIFLSTIK